MRMDYQMAPPALALQQQQQQQQSHNSLQHQQQLQLLQNVQQQHQQQQQQQMLGNMSQTGALPPLSSLPLQVVHNLPHLLTGGNNNNNNNNNGSNSSQNNLSNIASNNNNNNNNNLSNINNSLGNTNNLLRNTMQHVATQQQQLLNNLNSNNGNSVVTHVNGNPVLPPPTQLLQHHLQHLAHVNVNAAAAVVAVAANNLSNNLQQHGSNGGNVSSNNNNNNTILNHNNLNIIINNHAATTNNNNSNNNNNNPATPNANLTSVTATATPTVNTAATVAQQQQAHENSLVNSLVGVINNNNNNNNNNGNSNNNNNSNNGVVGNNNNNNSNNAGDDNNRWTQFQVQQLWKQHANYLNGRKSPFLGFICKANGKSTSNSKEIICPDDKYKEEGDIWNVEAQTAFLGPNLWDKTLPYDADLKYADLDEFLSENNIPDGLPGPHLGHSGGLGHRSDSLGHAAGLSLGLGHITTKRERSPSPSDCISPDTLNPPSPAESTFSFASSGRDFDPRTRAFSDEELKPQPMIKKSRKQFVPDELKDDKYWARRRKNNIAAKRSRDARRQKENQIAMRARYLEKENATLHQEVEQLKQENMDLRARLSKFQDV
ncbi:putative uncharacterized protein DDB_G0282129 isoform X12 [Scaptodrosophila lebanonensis]|uniref:BZIP domain-containing protein n=1 Tax=Drosophila lebanonensis TaxID=7225 RepID=A0A6J2UFP2_DROLE|nr:putative uncharacterized protein DDB_G0282129 isoform X12 [Scaptodrosophila lebanonensis]